MNSFENEEVSSTQENDISDDRLSIASQATPSVDATDEDNSFKATYEKASAAVAISYNEGDKSPFVSALGYESRAQAIIDMAKELGIYVHKDPVLLNELKSLKEGEQVPEQLFMIIAQILAFSYHLQGKTPEKYTREDGTVAVNTKA
ncbi:MAG: EscU/YscU/HrcU family type III secretion system export apparatus switch protein [Succinivibrio sp.]